MAYFVAPYGNNSNPGTQQKPWKTIGKATATVKAGDTVYIEAGVYREHVILGKSGAPGKEITFTAAPGDAGKAVIDGSGLNGGGVWGGLFHISGAKHVNVSGLTVRNSSGSGIFVNNSTDVDIKGNHTDNTFSSGIGVWHSHWMNIDGNDVARANNGGPNENITVAWTDHFNVSNNHVHHGMGKPAGGEGIDVKASVSYGKIYNNHIHDLPKKMAVYVDSWTGHTHDIEVFRNNIHHVGGEGICVASERGGLTERIQIHDNVIYATGKRPIVIGEWGAKHMVKNVAVYNNAIGKAAVKAAFETAETADDSAEKGATDEAATDGKTKAAAGNKITDSSKTPIAETTDAKPKAVYDSDAKLNAAKMAATDHPRSDHKPIAGAPKEDKLGDVAGNNGHHDGGRSHILKGGPGTAKFVFKGPSLDNDKADTHAVTEHILNKGGAMDASHGAAEGPGTSATQDDLHAIFASIYKGMDDLQATNDTHHDHDLILA